MGSKKKKLSTRVGYTWKDWEAESLMDVFLVQAKDMIAKGKKPLLVKVTVEEI